MFRQTICIPTSLSTEEATARLAAVTTPSTWNYYDTKKILFSGTVSAGGFRIRPLLHFRGGTIPVVKGKIMEADGGAVLLARPQLMRFTAAFLLIWSGALAVIFLAALGAAVRGKAPFWAPLAMLAMLGAGTALWVIPYVFSTRKTEERLRTLLEQSPEG